MTFSTIVPNANQSPGLFPAQNNENFTRLKAIIIADHNFTDSISTAQGLHNQATFINRATPSSIPIGGNGILYSQLDAQSKSQLRWFRATGDDYQLTGSPTLLASGSISLVVSSTTNIFTVPADSFGIIYIWRVGGLSSAMQWQSDTTNVAVTYVPTYSQVFPSLVVSSFPVTFQSTVATPTLNLTPSTTSLTFNGTYQYRIFQVV